MARVVIPPGTPTFSPGPVRTPILVTKGVPEGLQVVIKDNQSWHKYFEQVWNILTSLVSRPVMLSGLAADIPDPTLYPENSRFWSTDTHHESIVLYATPNDPTTASWQVMF